MRDAHGCSGTNTPLPKVLVGSSVGPTDSPAVEPQLLPLLEAKAAGVIDSLAVASSSLKCLDFTSENEESAVPRKKQI